MDAASAASTCVLRKTSPVPAEIGSLVHRAQWAPGNHEDGFLLGLDSLIGMWRQTLAS